MYTGSKITSFIVSNVKPRDYLHYVTVVYEFKNWLIFIYVSGKRLRFLIHSGYHHRDAGIIAANVTSIQANKVTITYRGKYGLRMKWKDNHGREHKGTIDLWHGFYTGKTRAQKKRPVAKHPTKSEKKMRAEEIQKLLAAVLPKQKHCRGCNLNTDDYCDIIDRARGLRTAIRQHQATHPGDDNCLKCDEWMRQLEGVYTEISNCPHH
jgi:hypothetical protein